MPRDKREPEVHIFSNILNKIIKSYTDILSSHIQSQQWFEQVTMVLTKWLLLTIGGDSWWHAHHLPRNFRGRDRLRPCPLWIACPWWPSVHPCRPGSGNPWRRMPRVLQTVKVILSGRKAITEDTRKMAFFCAIRYTRII